jgi:hypothetical protein
MLEVRPKSPVPLNSVRSCPACKLYLLHSRRRPPRCRSPSVPSELAGHANPVCLTPAECILGPTRPMLILYRSGSDSSSTGCQQRSVCSQKPSAEISVGGSTRRVEAKQRPLTYTATCARMVRQIAPQSDDGLPRDDGPVRRGISHQLLSRTPSRQHASLSRLVSQHRFRKGSMSSGRCVR